MKEELLKNLLPLAEEAALKAGEIIHEAYSQPVTVLEKEGGSSRASCVLTETDLKSQEIILNTLKPSCSEYSLALLSEEKTDDKERFVKEAFWCIDPLDGTLPFTEKVPGFSVSIALVSREGVPLLGVIYDPSENCLYSAVKGGGVFKNREPWNPALQKGEQLTLMTDRSFLKHSLWPDILNFMTGVAERRGLKGLEVLSHGGAALNALWCLEKAPACYFKLPKKEAGGGSLWDFAASASIFSELGASVADVYGNPLELNRNESTFMNHRGVLYASDSQLAKEIRLFIKNLQKFPG